MTVSSVTLQASSWIHTLHSLQPLRYYKSPTLLEFIRAIKEASFHGLIYYHRFICTMFRTSFFTAVFIATAYAESHTVRMTNRCVDSQMIYLTDGCLDA